MDNESINKLLNDKKEFIQMCKDVIFELKTQKSNKICKKIENNEIDEELNILLIELEQTKPFHLLIPTLRKHLKLCICDNETCLEALNEIRKNLETDENKNIIDYIKDFINWPNEKYEDIEESPLEKLLLLNDDIPYKLFPKYLECCEYINEITDITEI